MRFLLIICVALLATFGSVPTSRAERVPEDRRQATHVVIGTVEGVYVRKDEGALYYVVEIAVGKVDKGDGLKPGEALYVRCYMWDPDWRKGKKLSEEEERRLVFRGAAYDGVPKEGERIKAYIKHGWGKYAGVYPAWYDVLKEK
jgi:hypothetical protein